jgi:hypothetical protein
MRVFFKTLFGDARHVGTAAICVGVAALVLRTPLAAAAGVVLPVALMAAAAYLARH